LRPLSLWYVFELTRIQFTSFWIIFFIVLVTNASNFLFMDIFNLLQKRKRHTNTPFDDIIIAIIWYFSKNSRSSHRCCLFSYITLLKPEMESTLFLIFQVCVLTTIVYSARLFHEKNKIPKYEFCNSRLNFPWNIFFQEHHCSSKFRRQLNFQK